MTLPSFPRVLGWDFPIKVFQGLHTTSLSTIDIYYCWICQVLWPKGQDSSPQRPDLLQHLLKIDRILSYPKGKSSVPKCVKGSLQNWKRCNKYNALYKKKICCPLQLIGTILAYPISLGPPHISSRCWMPAVFTFLLPAINRSLSTEYHQQMVSTIPCWSSPF